MVTQTRHHVSNRRFSSVQNISQKWLFFIGDCPNVTAYLAQRQYLSYWGPVKFTDALLRGYGQVVYANNPVSGALVLLALTFADFYFSVAGLTTSSIGLLASLVLIPQNVHDIQEGLTVYNPLLIGLITVSALPERYGIQVQFYHWLLMLFAAVLSVYVTSAFSNILGSLTRFPLPCFTLPFNVVQPVLFLCIVSLTNSRGNTSSPLMQKQFSSSTPLNRNNELLHQNSPEDLMEISTQDFLFGGFLNLTDIIHHPAITNDPIPDEAKIAYSSPRVSSEIPKELQGQRKLKTPTFDLPQRLFDINSTEKTSKPEGSIAERHSGIALGHQTVPAMGTESSINGYDRATKSTVSTSRIYTRPENESAEAGQRRNRNAEGEGFPNWKAENEFNRFKSSSDSYDITSTNEVKSVNSVDITSTYGKEGSDYSDDEVLQDTDWGEVFSGVVLSMSRVYGSNYPQGAILIYVAVLLCSPILAAFALIGAISGTLTGLLLTDPVTYAAINGVYEGGWGSNGLLCAMAIGGYYFTLTWQAAVAAIFSAVFATALQFVLIPAFANGNLYPMSLPFNLSALLLLSIMSPGAIVRPVKLSTPENHRLEYRRHLHMQVHNTEEILQEIMEDGKVTSE